MGCIAMNSLIWVGPRESDIVDCQGLFNGSITFFGSAKSGNYSLSDEIGVRVNHNTDSNDRFGKYCNTLLGKLLASDPALKVMYYSPSAAHDVFAASPSRLVCLNDFGLLARLNDKESAREMASREIPVVPFQATNGLLADLPLGLTARKDLVIQQKNSSGGFGTYRVCAGGFGEFAAKHSSLANCLVSPYFQESIPLNVHIIILEQQIVVFPGSIQVVRDLEGRQIYLGADYVEYSRLPSHVIEKVEIYGRRFAEMCACLGYRGVLGVDFLLVNEKPLFLECNPRFQGSSPLLNRRLRAEGLPTLQELNLSAFDNGVLSQKELDELSKIRIGYSMISHVKGTWPHDEEGITQLAKCPEISDLHLDGLKPQQATETLAYLCSAVFDASIVSASGPDALRPYENLLRVDSPFCNRVREGDMLAVKVSLINQGVQISETALSHFESEADMKEGVFNSVDVRLSNGLLVNSPTGTRFASLSPWVIDYDVGGLSISYRGQPMGPVAIDKADRLASRLTKSGSPYAAYAFLAADRLRVHHARSCQFQNAGKGCRFCNIPPCSDTFVLDDAHEVIDSYLNESDFRHFLIGGGSGEASQEQETILDIVSYIRGKCDKPIYLMCLPPRNLKALDEYKHAGVDEIAFNLEIYDRSIAEGLMPAKGSIPAKQYYQALERAVDLWGDAGNVRSILIAGLETEESLLKGVEQLCKLGVSPILSAFRPLPSTPMENRTPPDSEWLEAITKRAESLCRDHGLSLGPACVACQNNVLSIPKI